MTDIILITLSTPTKTNYKTASALPYHIALNREKNTSLTIYSFNLNNVNEKLIEKSAEELNCNIYVIKKPWWFNLIFKFHLLFIRIFLPFPLSYYLRLPNNITNVIKHKKDTSIWIYGEEIAHFAKLFNNKCIITTPDCEALYYHRLLGLNIGTKSIIQYIRYSIAYRKYLNLARDFPHSNNIKYHLVGVEDLLFLKNLNSKINAYFIRHPHYETINRKIIKFHSPKIKILIAGRNDVYQHDATDSIIRGMIMNRKLSNYYEITFLGKGWESYELELRETGYNVQTKLYVENYIEEITQHNIQITAITVGTGTKGKVLDAFANGLLVIGNKYALENINIENKVSCLLYNTTDDIIQILYDIPKHSNDYEKIATIGMKQVLEFHNSNKVAQQFYELIQK